jgi:hypothetical protein
MTPDDCPSVFRLLAEMAEACESPTIAAHLDRCHACAERVEAVVRHATHSPGDAPYDCDDAMLLVACPDEVEPDERELASLFIHLVECLPCRALSCDDDDPSDDNDTGDDETRAQRPDAGFDAAPPDHDSLPLVEKCTFAWGPELGRGGMGRVSEVHDRRLGRTVVIKEPLLDDVLDWNQRQVLFARFEYEARVTACLSHPAIVAVHEAGRWRNGTPFYTMRRVRGVPLDEAVERAATAHERLGLLLHVIAATDAVAYAHSEGVLHRDLKPHNIVVGAFGETVVLDWGLATDLDTALDTAADTTGDASAPGPPQRDSATAAAAFGPMVLTTCGHIVGTPAYMAPEQALGSDARARP